MSAATMWDSGESDPDLMNQLSAQGTTLMPETNQESAKILSIVVAIDQVEAESPTPLKVVESLPPSPEEEMRLFLATSSDRDDLIEEMFDGSDFIPKLENRTSPLPIINTIVTKMYKDSLSAEDLKNLRSYIAGQYEAFNDLIDDNDTLVELIEQAAKLSHSSSDLLRGMSAFSEAANQFNNFMYKDTSLKRAEGFCSYLVVGDIF